MVAEDIVHDAEDLGAADAVFDADAFAGDGLIAFLLSGSEFAAARFLLGLVSRRAGWFITLEAGIFPGRLPGGKRKSVSSTAALSCFLPSQVGPRALILRLPWWVMTMFLTVWRFFLPL